MIKTLAWKRWAISVSRALHVACGSNQAKSLNLT